MSERRPSGLHRDQWHRYYYADEGPLPGVTSIVRILDRSGPLVGWAKREVAACAVRNADDLMERIAENPEDAEAWLASIPDQQRDTAADLGKRIHQLASDSLSGHVIPTEEERPYLEQYFDWLRAMNPRVLYTEALLVNFTLGYGGTLDLGVVIDGYPTLIDIKTSRNVYDETALQLAGYAGAEYTGSPDDAGLNPLPTWARFGVLHLSKSNWSMIPFDITPQTRDAFEAALRLYRWKRDALATTRGVPITPQLAGREMPV